LNPKNQKKDFRKAYKEDHHRASREFSMNKMVFTGIAACVCEWQAGRGKQRLGGKLCITLQYLQVLPFIHGKYINACRKSDFGGGDTTDLSANISRGG
jgi:hypothetical protein